MSIALAPVTARTRALEVPPRHVTLVDMSGVQLSAAALRLLSVWTVASMAMSLPAFLVSWFGDPPAPFGPDEAAAAWRLAVAQFGTMALVALALWEGHDWLARRIWGTAADPVVLSLSASDAHRAVFAGVGVLLVTNGLPELAEIVVAGLQLPDGFVQNEQMLSSRTSRLLGIAAQIAIGVGLIVGGSGLARALGSLRRAGGADAPREE